jgi:hypothetical protein
MAAIGLLGAGMIAAWPQCASADEKDKAYADCAAPKIMAVVDQELASPNPKDCVARIIDEVEGAAKSCNEGFTNRACTLNSRFWQYVRRAASDLCKGIKPSLFRGPKSKDVLRNKWNTPVTELHRSCG